MPTTTNFGWTTPADTDLVKDGALAIRTLGNGIDTSFLDLKGGTTNQILAKNSNTDLDFKWVTGGNSWTQVTTGSMSGSAVNLTSLAGYDNYVLILSGMSSATGADNMRVRVNAATTNYRQNGFNGGSRIANTTYAVQMDVNDSNSEAEMVFEIRGCLSTTGFKFFSASGWRSANVASGMAQAGIYESTSAITQINLSLVTYTFDAGTYYLYGSN